MLRMPKVTSRTCVSLPHVADTDARVRTGLSGDHQSNEASRTFTATTVSPFAPAAMVRCAFPTLVPSALCSETDSRSESRSARGHSSRTIAVAVAPAGSGRIMTLRRAAERMRAIGARFLFTGEVLGQRPMSQHRRALDIIDSESGLAGSILRPLSAALLPPTVPETEGWVRRDRLLELRGRTRKPQMALAKQFGISDYPTPAGGCLLTDKHFAARLRDYFAHAAEPRMRDMPLLTVGKHFRLAGGDKAVVARNQAEGERLKKLARPEDHLLEPQFSGPVTVLQGTAVDDAVKLLLQHCRKELPPKAVVTHAWQGHTEELPVSREVGGTTVTAQKVEAQSVW